MKAHRTIRLTPDNHREIIPLNIMAVGIAATARGGGDVSRPVKRENDNVPLVEQSI